MRLLLLLMLLCLPAQAALTFKVNKIEQGQRTPFPVSQEVKWSWVVNDESVRVLEIDLTLTSSEFSDYHGIRALAKSTRAEIKGNHISLHLNGLSDKIGLKGASGKKLILEVIGRNEGGPAVIDENCSSAHLVLRPKASSRANPFYVGASCGAETSSGPTFALSFPREIDFQSSTLFEAKGKGEPWRFYELPRGSSSAVMGRFVLSFQGKPYEFILERVSPVSEKEPTKDKRMVLSAGAGYSLLKIVGSDISVSDSEPALFLRIPHYPLVGALGAGMNIDLVMPLKSTSTALSYSQFEFFASYEIALGELRIRPKAGYVVFSESNNSSGVSLTANSVNLGAVFELGLGSSSLSLTLSDCGLGSQVIQSQYAVDLSFIHKPPTSLGWGLGAKLQSYTATSSLGIQRQFGQTLFYAMLAF